LIRKGAAKPQGKPGADLNDRFRVVFAPGAEDIKADFLKLYQTDTPERIRAMIPFPRVNAAWSWFNEAYQAGRMVAQAVDDRFLVYRDPLTGVYEVRDGEPFKAYTPGQHIIYEREGKRYDLPMKPSGRLHLWLPELGRMVFFTLKTTSYYDCMNISANLAAVQGIADALNHSNAAGIPLWIYRKKQSITWNKPDGTAARIDKWLVQIEVDPAYVKNAISRMSDYALTGGTAVGLLPTGEIAGTEDPSLVDEEEDEPENESAVQPTDAQDGDFRPEEQQHPAIDPPVVERKEEATPVEQAAPENPLRAAQQILAAAPHSGKALTRPMAPEVVKAALTVKAAGFAGREANPKQLSLAAMLLEQVFSGQPEPKKIRYSVTNYLFGHESLNDVSPADIVALLDWLKPTKLESNEYVVDTMAAKEASNLFSAANKAAGQLEIPF
jgi:hypothetical protein